MFGRTTAMDIRECGKKISGCWKPAGLRPAGSGDTPGASGVLDLVEQRLLSLGATLV